MFSIAGLYTEDHYIMFTCSAAESIKHIHHRMPAILQDGEIRDWLNPHTNYVDVKSLLCPFSGPLEWEHAR